MSECFGFEALTPVQAATLGPALSGADLLVRAQTGAGKTLSFLLPALDRLGGGGPVALGAAGAPGSIDLLVLSPVRELTLQIHQEASRLASYYGNMHTLCMIGGVPLDKDLEALAASASGPTALIATPGRLQDHLSGTPGFAARLGQVRVLVLDEVDQLASSFFRPAINEVIRALPPSASRQTWLYSATLSPEVAELAAESLAPNYRVIDFVQDEDSATPQHLEQRFRIVTTRDMGRAIWEALQAARAVNPTGCKVVVILQTARIAAYYAEVFRRTALAPDVLEMHARKKQSQRSQESDRFRDAATGILFTSDVSSRGLDYPGVSDVIQVGAPDSREDYVHRLGRTGRAGRRGRGLLLLHDFERPFLKAVGDLPLLELGPLEVAPPNADPVPQALSEPAGKEVMAEAYYSWINHAIRNSHASKLVIVREAKVFAAAMGALDQDGNPPRITEKNAIKMGVDELNDAALNIAREPAKPKVAQSHAVAPVVQMHALLLHTLQRLHARVGPDAKVVVFCVAPFVAGYYAEFFRSRHPDRAVFAIHSKVKQAARKKELKRFASAAGGTLFAADVSPQSLQLSDAAAVVQVGAPASRGAFERCLDVASGGEGILLLHDFERELLEELKDEHFEEVEAAAGQDVPVEVAPGGAGDAVLAKAAAQAYLAWLEHYGGDRYAACMTKLEVVQQAKRFADSIGATGPDGLPPPIAEKNAARMGFAGIDDPALNIVVKP